ncbi:Hypothetical protein D9617_2g055100 [Elsinoe fawcettii]|nr:Hypothetical protein D9617_2g055100 [Elsinoe fawcettii]
MRGGNDGDGDQRLWQTSYKGLLVLPQRLDISISIGISSLFFIIKHSTLPYIHNRSLRQHLHDLTQTATTTMFRLLPLLTTLSLLLLTSLPFAAARDCKQLGLWFEGFVGMGRNCQQTCADRAYWSRQTMNRVSGRDVCFGADGVSEVKGVTVTKEQRCNRPGCPALVQCQCKFAVYAWRVKKANQGTTKCGNWDVAIRLARETPFAPTAWETTNGDVDCGRRTELKLRRGIEGGKMEEGEQAWKDEAISLEQAAIEKVREEAGDISEEELLKKEEEAVKEALMAVEGEETSNDVTTDESVKLLGTEESTEAVEGQE